MIKKLLLVGLVSALAGVGLHKLNAPPEVTYVIAIAIAASATRWIRGC